MYYTFEIIRTIVDDTTQRPVNEEVVARFQGPDQAELLDDALVQLQASAYYSSADAGYRAFCWMRRRVTGG